jgi:phospholipid transport system transporter-binding protein
MTLIQITQQANTWRLSGDFIVNNMDAVLALTEKLTIPAQFELDFSEVAEVDTSAISFIFEMKRRASKHHVKMTIVHVPGNLQSLMQLYGVETFVV